ATMLSTPPYLRWLRNIWHPDRTARRPARSGRHPRRPSLRPLLELLEGRTTPTVFFTLGNPVPAPPSSMLFTVIRSGDLAPAVQVSYTTVDGSGPGGAHAGADYTATSGTLLFPANQTTETISVPALNSAVLQAPGSFGVALSSPMASAAFAPPQSFPTSRT